MGHLGGMAGQQVREGAVGSKAVDVWTAWVVPLPVSLHRCSFPSAPSLAVSGDLGAAVFYSDVVSRQKLSLKAFGIHILKVQKKAPH